MKVTGVTRWPAANGIYQKTAANCSTSPQQTYQHTSNAAAAAALWVLNHTWVATKHVCEENIMYFTSYRAGDAIVDTKWMEYVDDDKRTIEIMFIC